MGAQEIKAQHYVVDLRIQKVDKITPTIAGYRGGKPDETTSRGIREVEEIVHVIGSAADLPTALRKAAAYLEVETRMAPGPVAEARARGEDGF